jgi:uncharacterized membrane-anchored protein
VIKILATTFAFGTAAGDLLGGRASLGYVAAALLFVAAVVVYFTVG